TRWLLALPRRARHATGRSSAPARTPGTRSAGSAPLRLPVRIPTAGGRACRPLGHGTLAGCEIALVVLLPRGEEAAAGKPRLFDHRGLVGLSLRALLHAGTLERRRSPGGRRGRGARAKHGASEATLGSLALPA